MNKIRITFLNPVGFNFCLKLCEISEHHVIILFMPFSGASACVKLNLFEKAVTWCNHGLKVSFDFIFMVERVTERLQTETIMTRGG